MSWPGSPAPRKPPGARRRDVTLVAVSKTQPWEAVAPVLAAGQRVFGENRVQEAQERWARAARRASTLHLIGPLQSNKAADAVAFFDVIETLDREKLARVLADEIQKQGRAPRLYVQVNTGEEPQKAGVIPAEADAFIAAVPRDLWPRARGPDVHPAGRRAGRARTSPCWPRSPRATGWRSSPWA